MLVVGEVRRVAGGQRVKNLHAPVQHLNDVVLTTGYEHPHLRSFFRGHPDRSSTDCESGNRQEGSISDPEQRGDRIVRLVHRDEVRLAVSVEVRRGLEPRSGARSPYPLR